MPPVSKPELVTALQDMEEQETKRKWRRASIVIQTALRGKLARRRNSNVAFDPGAFKGVVPASAADGGDGGGGAGSGSGIGGESKGDSPRGAASNGAAAKSTKMLSPKLPGRDGNKGGKEGSIVGEACGPSGDAKRRGIFSQMDTDNRGAVSIQAFIDCLCSNKGLAERLGIPRTFVTQTPPDRLHDKIDEMFSPSNATAKSRAGVAGITVRLFSPVLIQ